ncbi:acyl-CoA dehydrogenase family protein [Nocardia sp. NBC_01499]|uniref:acyl-CoA dehydrogenase family protein n=1 Tax=Nocardia sp. NBC_01499 TaxID=2903597 RepID=UPI00386968BA
MTPASVHLTPGHEAFRSEVRAVLDAHVVPCLAEWERSRCIPRPAWRLLGKHGLLGVGYAPDRDLFHSLVLLEELGRTGYAGFRAAVGVHAYMATHYLAKSGSPFLRARYLAPAVAGEKIAALAVTEPDAGSDLAGLAVSATAAGEHVVLRGVKSMITNGTTADFFVVAARTGVGSAGPAGISLFVVDSASPGVSVRPQETVGWHCADTAEVRFSDVRVPTGNMIGRVGTGFRQLMHGFQLERFVAAALALGGIESCLDATRTHLRTRHVFGGRLSDLQSVRHAMAELFTELAAARHLVHDAAWRLSQDDLPAAECSMAKLYTTELACRVADRCLQLHGANGYLAGSAVARAHAEARAATMAAGPSEVMRDLIAGEMVDLG